MSTDVELTLHSRAAHLQPQPCTRPLRLVSFGQPGESKDSVILSLLNETQALSEILSRTDALACITPGFSLSLDTLNPARPHNLGQAYHAFTTATRRFIVADTSGYEHSTGHLLSFAAAADVAVIWVDATQELLPQIRQPSHLAHLAGVKHLVLGINRLHLLNAPQEAFEQLDTNARTLSQQLGFERLHSIPLTSLPADPPCNVNHAMHWYQGPSLLEHLTAFPLENSQENAPMRLSVESVNSLASSLTYVTGKVLSGRVQCGERIRVLPVGQVSTVAKIISMNHEVPHATAGQSISITLHEAVDIRCGDVISSTDAPPEVADHFDSTLVWLSDNDLKVGQRYAIKLGTHTCAGAINQLQYQIDLNSLEQHPSQTLARNQIGRCHLKLEHACAFEPYASNPDMGSFILTDSSTHQTVAIGMLNSALRSAQNIHWHAAAINKAARTQLNSHYPCVIWLTGLSGTGKSTIANLLEHQLYARGIRTYLLDGDNVRHGLNKDLGFSASDRVENIRRIGEVAKLMVDAGLVVISAFISPFRAEREMARNLVSQGEFIEVFVDTPLSELEKRDPKGLYKKARKGELKNFTGIDSPYEPPLTPDIHLQTLNHSASQSAELIVQYLRERQLIN